MPRPVCFVTQPIDRRADNVFDLYLGPALSETYDLIQSSSEPSDSIKKGTFDHLENDAIVLAFLGSPYRMPAAPDSKWLWNPNVMLESGYRMGIGRPIVFVREKKVHDDEPLLPFDLTDITVIQLLNKDDEEDRRQRQMVQQEIRDYVDRKLAQVPTPAADVYTYPAVTLAFDGGAGGKITAASKDAAEFFRYPTGKDVVGMSIMDLVNKLQSEMVPSQREAFNVEQERLIGKIFQGTRPLASVCIVFGDQPLQAGAGFDKAYLPIITRFRAGRGEPTTLEVVYLDVTALAIFDEKDRVVKCPLGRDRVAAPKSL